MGSHWAPCAMVKASWVIRRDQGKQAAEVAQLFAHLGLRAFDAAAGARLGQALEKYMAEAAILPGSSSQQVQLLIFRITVLEHA